MYVCQYEHEVGNPGSPKKKGKNSSSCAGEPYGSEPGNDSEMMDENGVEREAYSKEAPSKSPVVHPSKNHEDKDACSKTHSGGKQNDRNKNSSNSSKLRISPNYDNDEHKVGNSSSKKKLLKSSGTHMTKRSHYLGFPIPGH